MKKTFYICYEYFKKQDIYRTNNSDDAMFAELKNGQQFFFNLSGLEAKKKFDSQGYKVQEVASLNESDIVCYNKMPVLTVYDKDSKKIQITNRSQIFEAMTFNYKLLPAIQSELNKDLRAIGINAPEVNLNSINTSTIFEYILGSCHLKQTQISKARMINLIDAIKDANPGYTDYYSKTSINLIREKFTSNVTNDKKLTQ